MALSPLARGFRMFAGASLATTLLLTGCATAAPETQPPASDDTASTAPTEQPTMAPETETDAPEPDAAAPGAYVDYADGIIEKTEGDKALFFHASWCPKCRALDADLKAEGAPDGLTVFKVDYDARTDLRQQYGVTLQTTIVFVDDDGKKISSTVLYDDPSVASVEAARP